MACRVEFLEGEPETMTGPALMILGMRDLENAGYRARSSANTT